ncbi:MAG: ABC transporter ATP-binding protein [Pseudomonadota bacterium]
MPLPDNAIEIKHLVKYYAPQGAHKKCALNDISLNIPRGSIFGLLGPNGAGKSTLINILAGLTIKTEGMVKIWGMDIENEPRNARAAIGIVPQELNIDPFFSPRQSIDLQAGLYGIPKSKRRTDDILRLIGLYDQRNAYARSLSGGMRRRMLIGKAMCHNPPILVLDEPTAGVDIELRRQLWDNVRVLNEKGVTVLLTTHYLEEAEELCDKIAIINHGKLVANSNKNELLQRLENKVLCLEIDRQLSSLPHQLKPFNCELKENDQQKSQIIINYSTRDISISSIIEAVQQAGLKIIDLKTHESDLEDIFLQLTSKHA